MSDTGDQQHDEAIEEPASVTAARQLARESRTGDQQVRRLPTEGALGDGRVRLPRPRAEVRRP